MSAPTLQVYIPGSQNELGYVTFTAPSTTGTVTVSTSVSNQLLLLLSYDSVQQGSTYPSTTGVTSPSLTWTKYTSAINPNYNSGAVHLYAEVWSANVSGTLTNETITITMSQTGVNTLTGFVVGVENSGGFDNAHLPVSGLGAINSNTITVTYSTADPNALVLVFNGVIDNSGGSQSSPFTTFVSNSTSNSYSNRATFSEYTPGSVVTNGTAVSTYTTPPAGQSPAAASIVFAIASAGFNTVTLANSAGSFAVSGKASTQGLGTPLSSTSFVFNGKAVTTGQTTPASPGSFVFTGSAITTAVAGSTPLKVTSLDKRFRRPPLNLNSFAEFPYNTQTPGNQLQTQRGAFGFTGQPTNLVAVTNLQVSALEHNRSARPPNNLNLFKMFPYSTFIPYIPPVYPVSPLNNLGPRTPPFNLNLFNSFSYSTTVNSTILVTYPGAFAFTGQSLTIGNTGVLLPLSSGAFAFTGSPLAFQVDTPISLGSTSFAFVGYDAQLISTEIGGVTPYLLVDEAVFGGAFSGPLELVEFVYLPERQPFLEGATNLIIDRYKQEPTDVRQRGVDYTFFLVPGEILTNVVVEGISAQGVLQANTSPLVTPLVVSEITIDSTGVKFAYTVSGGQDGIEYTVQFETTTTLQTSNVEEVFSINFAIEDSFP